MSALYHKFIQNTLGSSSELAKKYFGHVSSRTKSDDPHQVLTDADIAIGSMIINKIHYSFPFDNIIDEEAGVINQGSQVTWIIDPIDGTSNFAAGLPTYGIMLGVLQNHIPHAGGIFLPAFDTFYYAQKGKGATKNNVPISVSPEKNLERHLVAIGLDYLKNDKEVTYREFRMLAEILLRSRNFRSSNSCFDSVHTADGAYGAWLTTRSSIWDNVAPQILIEEAGGIYTALNGSPLDYRDGLTHASKNYTVCAASPAIHKQLQEIILPYVVQ